MRRGVSGRFCRQHDKLCHSDSPPVAICFPAFLSDFVVRGRILTLKSKGSNGFSPLLPACTLPQVLCQIQTTVAGQVALVQVAWATIGAACAAWSLLWMTPSSFEQKEFTPVVLKRAGAPPAV